MNPRTFVTMVVVFLTVLVWCVYLSTRPAPDLRQFHAENTTKVVFEDGTTCYYHTAWRQMSCIHVEPYGPKEF